MTRLQALRIVPVAPGWEVSSGRERGIVYRELREALVAAAECFEANVRELEVARDGKVTLRRANASDTAIR